MGSRDDHLNMSTGERMSSLATSQLSARRLQARDSSAAERGQRQTLPMETAQAICAEWPDAPRKAAEKILEHYGPPNEATRQRCGGTAPGRGRAWS